MSALSSNLEAVLPSQASTSGGWRRERERGRGRLHVPDLFQPIITTYYHHHHYHRRRRLQVDAKGDVMKYIVDGRYM